MWPQAFATDHPAAPDLQNYTKGGYHVDCGPDWSLQQLVTSLKQGSHKSATTPDTCATLHIETDNKIANGFACKVQFGNIKHNLPPKLKISPVVCIPHKSKLYWVILNLSFKLRDRRTMYRSVNDTTTKKAPAEAMVQLRQ
eukprot:9734543-Ditylum_brightwellii.AAC.1